MPLRVDALCIVELMVAKQLYIVGMDCRIVPHKFDEPLADTDLVTVKGTGVALNRLAECADLGLFSRAALAGTLAAQAAPERTQAPALHAEIAPGPIDMEPRIDLIGST